MKPMPTDTAPPPAAWRAWLRLDAAVALIALVVLLPASLALLTDPTTRPQPAVVAFAAVGYAVLHLAGFLAIRHPLIAYGVASAVMAALALTPGFQAISGALFPSAAAYLLVIAQVAMQTSLVVRILALAGGVFGAALITVAEPHFDDAMLRVGAFVGLSGAVAAGWAVGLVVRLRRTQAEQQLRSRVERAIVDERMRINRDLHDIVAHSMTVMIAQSEVARALLRDDPERSEHALGVVIDSGRDALRGMRAVVAIDGEAPRQPLPTAESITALADSVRTPEVDVRLAETGERAPLRPEVALALHHGVREALTNAVRHAALPLRIDVRIAWAEDRVTAEIADDGGSGPARSDLGTGTGLIGIGERVRSAGGTLSTVDRRPHGWTVRIDLPVIDSPAVDSPAVDSPGEGTE